MFQQTHIADLSPIGSPGDLPDVIATWSDLAVLADLTGRVDPSAGLDGTGFWPVDVAAAAVDPTKQTLTGGITGLTADAANKRWTATQAVRDLTAAELAASLSQAQASKSAAVEAKRAAILTGGWSHDFGGSVGVKLLQTRDADDKINWLTLQGTCQTAVAAGQGATVGAEIRTADNVQVPLSFGAALQVMTAMASWGAAVMAASWKLKDAVAAATDQASLAAIDITQGWPATS